MYIFHEAFCKFCLGFKTLVGRDLLRYEERKEVLPRGHKEIIIRILNRASRIRRREKLALKKIKTLDLF